MLQLLLKFFGTTGYPSFLDDAYKATWDKTTTNEVGRDRVVEVLNFIRLLKQSGLKPTKATFIPGVGKIDVDSIYLRLLEEDLVAFAKQVAKDLRNTGVLHDFSIFKSFDNVEAAKDHWNLQLSVVLKPRMGNIDAALAALRGALYKKELPVALKNKIVGKKSVLPKYRQLVGDFSTIGGFPITIKDGNTTTVNRSSDGCLVFKAITHLPFDTKLEIPQSTHKKMVIKAFRKSLRSVV